MQRKNIWRRKKWKAKSLPQSQKTSGHESGVYPFNGRIIIQVRSEISRPRRYCHRFIALQICGGIAQFKCQRFAETRHGHPFLAVLFEIPEFPIDDQLINAGFQIECLPSALFNLRMGGENELLASIGIVPVPAIGRFGTRHQRDIARIP